MKILIAHNHYGHYATGGEGMVFNAEATLLSENNFEVKKYERTNSEIADEPLYKRIQRIKHLHWSSETFRDVGRIMDEFNPDILHVHNYKYLFTPSIFGAAKQRGIKTILTLHNYFLNVPCGNFMTKESNVCELCLRHPTENILTKLCAQGSFQKSYLQYKLFKTTKNKLHNLTDLVDCFIVLTQFAKEKLLTTGIPENQISIKPNFVVPLNRSSILKKRDRAVFVGRLSYEKGCLQLIHGWTDVHFPLLIIGSGPLEAKAKILAKNNPYIKFIGSLPNEKIKECLLDSSFLVFPSMWYEGMPMTILEAMSAGIPVLATDLGARRELVTDGVTGLLYNPERPTEFISSVNKLISDDDLVKNMGETAKEEYYKKYTPQINLRLLSNIYYHVLSK